MPAGKRLLKLSSNMLDKILFNSKRFK